jgi:hypothetical protein
LVAYEAGCFRYGFAYVTGCFGDGFALDFGCNVNRMSKDELGESSCEF